MDTSNSQADLALLLEAPGLFPTYEDYTPLDKRTRSIRLLRIWHEPNREIHAAIEHASLDDNIEYEALSYCWGPPDVPRQIHIGSSVLSIRSSLHGLLDALCQNNQSLPVWVDSVCINQNDVIERNWQVSMMGDIYRHATRVKSWIGPSDAYAEYVLAYVNHHRDELFLSSMNFAWAKQKALEALQVIADRPYWKRLWVIQEMAFARQHYILCGSSIISWESFLDAYEHDISPNHIIHTLRDLKRDSHEWLTSSNEVSPGSSILTECDGQICYAPDQHSQQPESRTVPRASLITQMSRLGNQACEDPRDKIFALLSLAEDGYMIDVDYTKSLADLLIEVVVSTYDSALSTSTYPNQLHVSPEQRIAHFRVHHLWREDFIDKVVRSLVCTGLLATSHNLLKSLSSLRGLSGIRHQAPQEMWSSGLSEGRFFVSTFEEEPGGIITYQRRTRLLLNAAESILIAWESYKQVPRITSHRGILWSPTGILLRMGEIQLCPRAEKTLASSGTECQFFLHFSPFAVMATICYRALRESNKNFRVEAFEASLQDRRRNHPRPELCVCEVSSELNKEAFRGYRRKNKSYYRVEWPNGHFASGPDLRY